MTNAIIIFVAFAGAIAFYISSTGGWREFFSRWIFKDRDE